MPTHRHLPGGVAFFRLHDHTSIAVPLGKAATGGPASQQGGCLRIELSGNLHGSQFGTDKYEDTLRLYERHRLLEHVQVVEGAALRKGAGHTLPTSVRLRFPEAVCVYRVLEAGRPGGSSPFAWPTGRLPPAQPPHHCPGRLFALPRSPGPSGQGEG